MRPVKHPGAAGPPRGLGSPSVRPGTAASGHGGGRPQRESMDPPVGGRASDPLGTHVGQMGDGSMTALALALAEWAGGLRPDPADLELADRSLRDTVAVALAASGHPVTRLAAGLPDGARWAVAAHVLDFDDLHMESTAHISALCVPVALATGGGARGYLAAAGVMARLGVALGWAHYSAGWHATCTAGALGSAAGAAAALGLTTGQTATALALAV